ncbi:MAG TPA: tetratricopeptide repeat protein [Myxococcaceae bacterium]|nr:tetratricopeptide repeat protein [Myxococcaceae bacterium]
MGGAPIPVPPSYDFDFGAPPAPEPAPSPSSDPFDFGGPPPTPQPAAPAFDFLPSHPSVPASMPDFSLDFGNIPSPPPEPAPAAAFSFDLTDLPVPASATPKKSIALGPTPPLAAAPPSPPPVSFAAAPTLAPPPPDIPTWDAPAIAEPPPPTFAPPTPEPIAAPAFRAAPLFENLPSPAPSAPAANPMDLSFGEIPLGEPKATDNLEVDLSAPLPPRAPAAPVDGLEMLNFIDETAKEAKAEKAQRRRFHIRRRSGKIFGPFEEGVVVKMLEDGQLLGNEEVSLDGEEWSAIGTVPAFQGALHKLMEALPSTFAAEPRNEARPQESAETMERLKALYEGRMAAVTVVDRRADTEKLRKRVPLFILSAALVLLIAAGASLAFTRYGLFGLKYLIPAKVAPGSTQFTQLQKAREALLADTYKSYKEARDVAQSILRAKEYPEVRAVWCQAIFSLDRRYAAAKPAELAAARGELTNIVLIGEKHPEVVKALAGDALASSRPDQARLLLEDAVIRNDGDPELKLLLAEAYVARNQPERAVQTLEKVLAKDPVSAKALHALGTLHQRKAESLLDSGKREETKQAAEKAEQLFAAALKAAPEHVVSSVELAAIALLVHQQVDAAASALARALDEKNRTLLGPAELARARALNGTVHARRFRAKEAVAELEEALKLDKTSVFAKAQLGRIYLAQKEFAKAVPLLKEASQKEPQNLDYVEGYLAVLLGAGQMQDALTVLQTANGQFPDTPRIAYLDARVNDALDNTKPAEESYLRAIRGDAGLYEANLHLARLYLRARRLPEARKQLEDAIAKASESAAVNAGMGELLLAEGNVVGAKAAFGRAAELDPNLSEAQLGLSRVAFAENDVDGASQYVDRALELDPRIKGGFLQKGFVLWKKGKLDEAISALGEAKKNEPGNVEVTITLGAVKLAHNDLTGAEAALLAALSQEPRNHKANFYRARVKSRRAEHTQAIESMKAALEAAPKNAAYHYEMGINFREAKKSSEAMAEWKIAIELDPSFADAMQELGQAHLDRGEFEPAIDQFEKALKVDHSRASLRGLIGDAYFQAAHWDKAIKQYREALKADPRLTYVYYKIGRALSEKGKPKLAVEWYRKATAAEPDNAMPWYYLGFLYKERRQRPQAIAAFRAYLQRRPDAPDKKEIEDEIYDLKQGH